MRTVLTAFLAAVSVAGFAYGHGEILSTGSDPVNGAAIAPTSASANFIDAGTMRVNTSLDMYAASINYPGTESSKYLFLACDAQSVRLAAQCSGGGAHTLDFYSGSGGNKQWSVDPSGHLVPASSTQKAKITNNSGTITLSGGTGTATVTSGARCVCTDSTANASVKCAVSGTTLTATGTTTDVITYLCDR